MPRDSEVACIVNSDRGQPWCGLGTRLVVLRLYTFGRTLDVYYAKLYCSHAWNARLGHLTSENYLCKDLGVKGKRAFTDKRHIVI